MANMTSKRTNGAREAQDNPALFGAMQMPVATSFAMSQRFALESAKFWARRMRAYADQMEELMSCRSADELAGAQTRFFERMREDYAAESEALGALLAPEPETRRRSNGDTGAEA
jgi:hypothetical protein